MRKRHKKKLRLQIIATRAAAQTMQPWLSSCAEALAATNAFLQCVSRMHRQSPRCHLDALRAAYKTFRRAFRTEVQADSRYRAEVRCYRVDAEL